MSMQELFLTINNYYCAGWNKLPTFSFRFPCFHLLPFCLLVDLIFLLWLLCNISNMRKSVSSNIQTLRSGLKKTRCSRVFLINFKVFGYLMKHSFKCLIWLLKALMILREIQSKSSLNFMIIRITYPNLLHGSDFLCFLYELLMSLRIYYEKENRHKSWCW